jgi:hypothetical protein
VTPPQTRGQRRQMDNLDDLAIQLTHACGVSPFYHSRVEIGFEQTYNTDRSLMITLGAQVRLTGRPIKRADTYPRRMNDDGRHRST